jgi:stage V sporulation protein SpoVS
VNNATRLLALYTRDLLELAEGSVVIMGRVNIERGDTDALQISVDQLATSTPLTDSERYDGAAEIMHVDQTWSSVMTIDFMGADAYNQVIRFVTLNRHQKGHELKESLGIDLQIVSGITDLKILQGEQYSERYQIEVTMMHNIGAAIETLRIDSAEIYIPEEGVDKSELDKFLTN